MILKIQKTSPTFSWSEFSRCFVRGGLPLGRFSYFGGLPTRGVTRRTIREEPKYKKGPNQWGQKYTYKINRPVRFVLRRPRAPQVVTEGQFEREEQARLDELRVGKRVWGGRLSGAFGWPDFRAQARINHVWRTLTRKRVKKIYYPGGVAQGYNYVTVFKRRVKRRRRWVFYYKWFSDRGYRARFTSLFNHTVRDDSFRRYLTWRFLERGVLSLRGELSSPAGLDRRLKFLLRRARAWTRLTRQVKRLSHYQKYVFEKLPKKVTKAKRQLHRYRRRRLRRFITEPTTLAGWSTGLTRRGYQKFKVNRLPWLDEVKQVAPPEAYVTTLHTWVTTMFGRRVATPWEYTYFKMFGFYIKFQDRKNERSRRWRIQDHPSIRVPFQEVRTLREGWFNSSALFGGVLQLRAAKKDNPDAPVYNSGKPPLQGGLFSAVFWSLQEWGRGTRWRTRPAGRALTVFLKTLRNGFTREYDAVQWNHAATSATGVRYSLLGEHEVQSQHLGVPPSEVRISVPVRITVPRYPLGLAVRLVLAWCVYVFWFFVFTPLWWVYSRVCKVWLLLGWAVTLAGWVGYLSMGVPYQWGRTMLKRPRRLVRILAKKTLADYRPFRTVRWVYTAWLMAYSSEDDQGELEIQVTDEEEKNFYFNEDSDLPGENGEDWDELVGSPFKHEVPMWPWQTWWNKEVESFYDEGVEIAREIILEEAPYPAKLVATPVVDFLVRLPGWGLLELAGRLTLAVKLDLQQGWYTLLTWGDTPGRPAGRIWKIPLVGAALVGRVYLVGVVFFLLSSCLGYSEMKLLFTYSWGVPFQEEYYFTWLVGCAALAVKLVGPASWKDYLFGEVGLGGLLFLVVGSTGLTTPEEYYPHRAAPLLRSHLNERTALFYSHNYSDVSDDRGPGGYAGVPSRFIDYEQLRPAQLRGYGEWPYDPEMDEPNDFHVIPDLHDNLPSLWYPTEPDRWGRNMEVRHPAFKRNNFYDVDFTQDTDPWGYSWPTYYVNGPRNTRVLYTRDENEAVTLYE